MLKSPSRRRRTLLRPNVRAAFMISVLGVICIAVGIWAERTSLRSNLVAVRAESVEELNSLRAGMENLLNADVNLIRGLVSYIRAVPDIDQVTFTEIAADLVRSQGKRLRNLALARDLVVSHVFPYGGNEKVLGLDYREVPAQWPQVKRAIDTNEIVIAGPLELVQGGVGVIARFPVYLHSKEIEVPRLWGIISTVIDFEAFLESVGIDDFTERYDIIVQGRDGRGADGDVFWRSADIEPANPVSLRVHVISGHWIIKAAPRAGWPTTSDRMPVILLFLLLVFVTGSIVSLGYMRYDMDIAKATDMMRRARDEAERANAAKSEFLASMSHELRTPLNAITGFSDMLKHEVLGDIGNEKYREYAEHIHTSGEHLLAIVNDVLDLAKVEAGKMSIAPQTFALEPALQECTRFIGRYGGKRSGGIEIEVSGDATSLHADPRIFRQIMINLLSNADKYTPVDGAIRISSERDAHGRTLVRVADEGSGIPAHDLDRVLEPFGQSRENVSLSHEGTGLGLSLSRKLMELHGGELKIESTEGVGTTVTLVFPDEPSGDAQNPL